MPIGMTEDECGALKLYIDGNSEKIADDVHDLMFAKWRHTVYM